jgi:hypothetical protein
LSQQSPAESVLSGRAVAVTAIEHGNIIITVASVSRDPEPMLVSREDYFVTTILGGPLGGETWTDRTWSMMLRNHALAVSRVAEFVSMN